MNWVNKLLGVRERKGGREPAKEMEVAVRTRKGGGDCYWGLGGFQFLFFFSSLLTCRMKLYFSLSYFLQTSGTFCRRAPSYPAKHVVNDCSGESSREERKVEDGVLKEGKPLLFVWKSEEEKEGAENMEDLVPALFVLRAWPGTHTSVCMCWCTCVCN